MPFPPRIAIFAYQFLLFGVHADHWLAGFLKRQDLLVDMAKLRVAVHMALAFVTFAMTLQTVAQIVQQLRRLGRTDLMALLGQLIRQAPHAFAGPEQGTHRVTARCRADQARSEEHTSELQSPCNL